jgi:hypothetical protein
MLILSRTAERTAVAAMLLTVVALILSRDDIPLESRPPCSSRWSASVSIVRVGRRTLVSFGSSGLQRGLLAAQALWSSPGSGRTAALGRSATCYRGWGACPCCRAWSCCSRRIGVAFVNNRRSSCWSADPRRVCRAPAAPSSVLMPMGCHHHRRHGHTIGTSERARRQYRRGPA